MPRRDDRTPDVLAYLTTLLMFMTVGSLFFVTIPEGNKDVVYLVTGQVVGGWLMALGYYYQTTAQHREQQKSAQRAAT